MSQAVLQTLKQLGYADVPEALYSPSRPPGREHAYALEVRNALGAAGDQSVAGAVLGVYEVEGVPAVCLVAGDPKADAFEELRSRLWNQGLISLVLVVGDDAVRAWPVVPKLEPSPVVPVKQATRESPYSAYGVRSGALQHSHPAWFDTTQRIDRYLLRNLEAAITQLRSNAQCQFSLTDAQHLLAQVLFVSYLEHRGLVSEQFQQANALKPFHQLLHARDGAGLDHLFERLKKRFNGDFLAPEGERAHWTGYPEHVFDVLDRFLSREDLAPGQTSLWSYDFRYIPVELLSGIYETFLQEKKKTDAAYYTPRHLANLAVDEAFRDVARPDQEIVWDGACGSGILITTAFRRMLGAAEAAAGRPLGFQERSKLLTEHVFGGDINDSACKVTAFSLYLCLLEDLPEDATDPASSLKLPHLIGKNIFGRGTHGDAFSGEHPIQLGLVPRPTCVISNPPWLEPEDKDPLTFDVWAERAGLKITLRQIALAYAFRVCELAAPGARLVLILPGGAFLRQQHYAFVRQWLAQVSLQRLINFSDLRNVLFPGAKHPCVVAVADNRATEPNRPHFFDYVTPKADTALHYNRLTIYASDRKRLEQSRVRANGTVLRSLYWCSDLEVADIERLRVRGTLKGLQERGLLIGGTGFHAVDNVRAQPIAPGWLRKLAHISARNLPAFGPALPAHAVGTWKDSAGYETVAGQGDRALYEGARVIVPNGMTPAHRIRAFATTTDASVTVSCSVLRFKVPEPDLARFLAAYLSSRLAAYLAMVLAPSAIVERTQIKLAELLSLPFFLPTQHPDPKLAKRCIREVASYVKGCESQMGLQSTPDELPAAIEASIRAYFGVSEELGQIIDEVAELVLPNLQPTSVRNLPTPLQEAPERAQLERYAHALANELGRSRQALGGQGHFQVQVAHWHTGSAAGLAMVTVRVSRTQADDGSAVGDVAADQILADLRAAGLLDGVMSGGLSMIGDVLIQDGATIRFAKPLVRRLWLTSAALDDALRVVQHVHAQPAIAA